MFDIVSDFTYLSLLFEFTSEMYENLMDLEIPPQYVFVRSNPSADLPDQSPLPPHFLVDNSVFREDYLQSFVLSPAHSFI